MRIIGMRAVFSARAVDTALTGSFVPRNGPLPVSKIRLKTFIHGRFPDGTGRRPATVDVQGGWTRCPDRPDPHGMARRSEPGGRV